MLRRGSLRLLPVTSQIAIAEREEILLQSEMGVATLSPAGRGPG